MEDAAIPARRNVRRQGGCKNPQIPHQSTMLLRFGSYPHPPGFLASPRGDTCIIVAMNHASGLVRTARHCRKIYGTIYLRSSHMSVF